MTRSIELKPSKKVLKVSYLDTLFNFVPLARLENKTATFNRIAIVEVAVVVWSITESFCLVYRFEPSENLKVEIFLWNYSRFKLS